MSKESIPKSTRHVRCLQELVEDQKRRVAFLRESGDVRAAHRAQSLLVVFEQCLASARYMLATQPRGRGVEE
jgi:hypothetical protein